MSDRPARARSFETVAQEYERHRPDYPAAAIEWAAAQLGLAAGSRVVDVGAGTGKLTRGLVAAGFEAVAVEPAGPMLDQLRLAVPEAEAHEAHAEEIPLPDASVDSAFAGQAFHWFDRERALPELQRVVRPGGGIALLWNRWDEEDPLLSQVDALLHEIRPPVAQRVEFPLQHERGTFRQPREMSVDALVDWAGSTSGWVNAPPAKRREIESEIRRLGDGHAGEVSIATDVIVAWPGGG